jgi:hypothetical protein
VRPLLPWAVTVALAGAAHLLAGSYLAGRDVVLAILVGGRVSVALVVLVLLVSRLFLFLLAPGWALYLLARMALARRR